jgi:hypothetical protein
MIQAILRHFSLKSLIGDLVAVFVLVCNMCGVDVHDLAPSLSVAISNFANASAALVPLGFAVWGHIQLAQKHAQLTGPVKTTTNPLGGTPSALNLLPFALALGGVACALS